MASLLVTNIYALDDSSSSLCQKNKRKEVACMHAFFSHVQSLETASNMASTTAYILGHQQRLLSTYFADPV